VQGLVDGNMQYPYPVDETILFFAEFCDQVMLHAPYLYLFTVVIAKGGARSARLRPLRAAP
jgi:hypothetical protein